MDTIQGVESVCAVVVTHGASEVGLHGRFQEEKKLTVGEVLADDDCVTATCSSSIRQVENTFGRPSQGESTRTFVQVNASQLQPMTVTESQ